MTQLEGCRILVTGGNGYIGQHLIPALARSGARLTLFDSLHCEAARFEGISIVCDDIRDLQAVKQAVKSHQVIVHLACLPVGPSVAEPAQDFEVNARGTFNVLEAARQAGVDKVIYSSSAEVYGRPRSLPVREDHVNRPVTPYGASKLCGEVYCRTYQEVYGLKSVILRFFNIYGQAIDRRPRPTVDAIFVRRVAAGLPPVLYGNSSHARDFIHVKDVVWSLVRSIEREAAVGETINIASGSATSLEQLARIAIDSAGLNLKPEIRGPFEEPVIIQADIHKARRMLDFQPSHSLADEMKAAVAELQQAEPDRKIDERPE